MYFLIINLLSQYSIDNETIASFMKYYWKVKILYVMLTVLLKKKSFWH